MRERVGRIAGRRIAPSRRGYKRCCAIPAAPPATPPTQGRARHRSACQWYRKTRPRRVRPVERRRRSSNGLAGYRRPERKSVVKGKSVSVRVDLGGRRSIKKKKINKRMSKQTSAQKQR